MASYYLKDRGEGVSSSMFGTYVQKGQLLVYPFYEYYYDSDMEYSPDEFGYNLVHDYRGNYRAHEGLIFLGYGITDWLMVEFETAVISATLERSDDYISGMPNKLKESGLGDVEGQLRWRLFGGFEGSQDEVELITEAQLHLNCNMFLSLIMLSGPLQKQLAGHRKLDLFSHFNEIYKYIRI